MHLKLKILLLTLAFTAGYAAEGPVINTGHKAYVYLKAKVQTSSSQIILGEVAEIGGFDEALISTLNNLPLGPAPLPGQSLILNRSDIRHSLVNHRIDPVNVALIGENRVEVSRAGRTVSAAELTSLAEDYLNRCWEGEEVRLETLFSRIPEDVTLPGQDFTLRVLTPVQPRVTGAVALSIAVLKGDQVVTRFPVSLKVRVFRKVAVMNKPMHKGEIVSADDLSFMEREITGKNNSHVTTLEQAVGKRLKRNIKEGQILTLEHLESPPLIERGDEVTLIVEYRGIRIGCMGRAWQSGRRGERILVRNQYGKNLTGTVKDSRTVLITP